MGLNIKNSEVERLASALAEAQGITKTEAIRRSLADTAQHFGIFDGPHKRDHAAFNAYLEEMWAKYPAIREFKMSKEADDALFE